jgi:hypothetical protein
MTPMFHEGENSRLWAHAARPEPVPPSSIRLAVSGHAPEGFALHRTDRAVAVPVPAFTSRRAKHAAGRRDPAADAPAAPVALCAINKNPALREGLVKSASSSRGDANTAA